MDSCEACEGSTAARRDMVLHRRSCAGHRSNLVTELSRQGTTTLICDKQVKLFKCLRRPRAASQVGSGSRREARDRKRRIPLENHKSGVPLPPPLGFAGLRVPGAGARRARTPRRRRGAPCGAVSLPASPPARPPRPPPASPGLPGRPTGMAPPPPRPESAPARLASRAAWRHPGGAPDGRLQGDVAERGGAVKSRNRTIAGPGIVSAETWPCWRDGPRARRQGAGVRCEPHCRLRGNARM